jgi:hypothetical protein
MKLIDAFKNPVSRTRAIIWTGTALTALLLFVAVMVGATTSYWFCAEICHKVQDDTITSYQRSTHSKVGCTACHMPLGANPVVFLLHKVEALGELPPTISNTFEIPLNGESHLAMNAEDMPSKNCTQCHTMSNRKVTPSAGIIMDHEAHEKRSIACSVCHNRVAHDESGDWQAINVDPQTGELNRGHENFMEMTACYRCHRLADDGQLVRSQYSRASGECAVCHTADFKLKPEDHETSDFVKAQHGKLAVAETERVAEAMKEEGGHEEAPAGHLDPEAEAVARVPGVEKINACYTCHEKKFCNDCHGGIEMPHPADFTSTHRDAARENTAACVKCHGEASCTTCHHSDPNVPGYEFKTGKSWMSQHAGAAELTGAAGCFNCHKPTYCANCHVNGGRSSGN